MKLKSKLIKIIKTGLSLLIAILVLNIFSFFYYNTPNDYECTDCATVFYRDANKFYSIGTEGYSNGRTNNEGYMNLYDYKEGMPIDVLIMGTSHMEAFQVDMDDSAASILNSMIDDGNVYNIGLAAHTFLNCAINFNAAVEKYKPRKYVVIEVTRINYSDYDLTNALQSGKFDIPGINFDNTGIKSVIKKNCFLKLFCWQGNEYINKSEFLKLINTSSDNETSEERDNSPLKDTYNNPELINSILANMKNTASKYGAKVILLYHPVVFLEKDGSLSEEPDFALDSFIKECNDNGIIFYNMKDRFFSEYKKNYSLPYGFLNSTVCDGHLNKNGHRMVAEELFKVMEENK